MSDDSGTDPEADKAEDLQALKFVGPATAEVVDAADFDAGDIRDKHVSYRMLVEAGTNHGVATKIRREHSLPWSITGKGSDDLEKRSDQVSGLSDDERAWVAESSGDWEASADEGGSTPTSADGGGDSESAEAAWRDRSKPTPVGELEGLSEEDAETLSDAGINSVRSLATITPEQVADLLGLEEETVAEWRDEAAEAAKEET